MARLVIDKDMAYVVFFPDMREYPAELSFAQLHCDGLAGNAVNEAVKQQRDKSFADKRQSGGVGNYFVI